MIHTCLLTFGRSSGCRMELSIRSRGVKIVHNYIKHIFLFFYFFYHLFILFYIKQKLTGTLFNRQIFVLFWFVFILKPKKTTRILSNIKITFVFSFIFIECYELYNYNYHIPDKKHSGQTSTERYCAYELCTKFVHTFILFSVTLTITKMHFYRWWFTHLWNIHIIDFVLSNDDVKIKDR